DDLSVPGTESLRDAALPRRERHRREGPEIGLASALKITLVVELLDGGAGRESVGEVVCELESAHARLDRLRAFLAGRHDMLSSVAAQGDPKRVLDPLDVRQPPCLREQRDLGAVEAEEHLE